MLKIYGSAKSRARRTLWMAGELGLQYQHFPYAPRSPETRTPEFLAMNANARVPVIDDDGFILCESMAINFYLAKKHNSPLYPADPKNLALALQWSLWETDRLDRQMTTWAQHTSMLPEAERNKALAESTWAEIEAALNVLEGALKKQRWLAGTDFSVGDLNVAAAMFRALSMDLVRWPGVKEWLDRCWSRPAGQKVKAM